VPASKGKAQLITEGKVMMMTTGDASNPLDKFARETRWAYAPAYEAEIVSTPPAWEDIPQDKVLVVVVSNGLFEGAGVAYCESEYKALTSPDGLPRTYVLMDKDVALRASGAPGA
jgi:hypothetical protein